MPWKQKCLLQLVLAALIFPAWVYLWPLSQKCLLGGGGVWGTLGVVAARVR